MSNHQHESVPDSTRLNALVKASGIAIGVDFLLIILKYLLATLTSSPVLLADALHSGADLGVSLTVLLSIVIHHYFKNNTWLREAECVVAVLIALVLMVGSGRVIWGVIKNDAGQMLLLRGIPLVIAIAGISVALGITFVMSRFKRGVGEEYASIAFIAEGKHTHSDFLTSFGVWLTLLLGYVGIHIERFMTVLVGLTVLHIGIRLFFQALYAFTITPACVAFLKKYTPLRIRSKLSALRQFLVKLYGGLTSLIASMFFTREEWIFNRKKPLILSNVVLVVLLYIGTGVYTVLPYQTGLELLFGKVVEQNPPGWHIHVPKPFGGVVRVDTGVIARVESGFRTKWYFEGTEPAAYLWEYTHTEGRYRKVPEEAIAITGDENLVDINFLCYYRIVDPVLYAFNTENAHETLRSLFCYEVHAETGRYSLDSLLTSDRGNIQTELLRKMKRAVGQLPLGVEILNVYMREVHPPIDVVPDYRAVASARESKIEIIHTANTYANALLPLSRGEATALTELMRTEGNTLGIDVKQVFIKCVMIPDDNTRAVYERMQAERNRIARKYVAEGEETAVEIRAEADKQSRTIIAEASKQAAIIRGQAEAQAMKIYGDTYQNNLEFYQYLRSLEAYKNMFNEKTTIILDSTSPILEIFFSGANHEKK